VGVGGGSRSKGGKTLGGVGEKRVKTKDDGNREKVERAGQRINPKGKRISGHFHQTFEICPPVRTNLLRDCVLAFIFNFLLHSWGWRVCWCLSVSLNELPLQV
jgi:hypothetical protein